MFCFCYGYGDPRGLHVLTHSFPTRRSSDLCATLGVLCASAALWPAAAADRAKTAIPDFSSNGVSWAGFVAPKVPSEAVARLFNDFEQPKSGQIGRAHV